MAVAGVLLKHGADINISDNDGNTPLRAAQDPKTYADDDRHNIYVECEGCATIYEPGRNAICITSGEMVELIGPGAARMGINIMLARGKAGQFGQVISDRELILEFGPKGWTCQKCHRDNRWQPMTYSGISRWKMSGEPEAWVWGHLQGWGEKEWLELLASLQASEFWPMDEAVIRRHLESLRAKL
jgi:hypothetical protein